MARWFKLEEFDADETRAVALPIDDGKFGKLAVFAVETGAGSSTLAVNGSFTDSTGVGTSLEVKSATSTGSGSLTQIVGLTEFPFPFLHLIYNATGASASEVYVVFM
jgi:hypothetical protein